MKMKIQIHFYLIGTLVHFFFKETGRPCVSYKNVIHTTYLVINCEGQTKITINKVEIDVDILKHCYPTYIDALLISSVYLECLN